MNTGSPSVSVVIPVYNRARLVAGAIESALAQSHPCAEILIVDDGSTDDIDRVARSYEGRGPVRLIRKPNGGVSSARNRGIEEARGDFVAFLDSDDVWLPSKLELQLRKVNDRPDPLRVLAMTQTEVRSDGFSRVLPARRPRSQEDMGEYLYCARGFAQCSSMLASAELAREVRFRDGLNQFEDHLFLMDCAAHGAEIVMVGEPLVVQHDDGRSDRLSAGKTSALARQFRLEAGDLMTERAGAAFDAAELTPEMWESDRGQAIRLHVRALRLGAVTGRQAIKTLVRSMISPSVYRRYQRAFFLHGRD